MDNTHEPALSFWHPSAPSQGLARKSCSSRIAARPATQPCSCASSCLCSAACVQGQSQGLVSGPVPQGATASRGIVAIPVAEKTFRDSPRVVARCCSAAWTPAVKGPMSWAHPGPAWQPLAAVAGCAGTAPRLPWLGALPPAPQPEPGDGAAKTITQVFRVNKSAGWTKCTVSACWSVRKMRVNPRQHQQSPTVCFQFSERPFRKSIKGVSRRLSYLQDSMPLRQHGALPAHLPVLFGELCHLHLHLNQAHLPPCPAATRFHCDDAKVAL